MGTVGILIFVGVILFVLALFVGLVWLFVKISGSPEAKARAAGLEVKAAPSSPDRHAKVPVATKAPGTVPPRRPGTGESARNRQATKAKGRKTP